MMNHDPELTIQDADIMEADFIAAARTLQRLKKKGICLHTWVCAPSKGQAKCNDCQKVWPSAAELVEEQIELRAQYF